MLTERLAATQDRLLAAAALTEAGTPSPHRDPVTGVMSAAGLSRWTGGPSLDGMPMPALGAILIDLPELDAIVERHGRFTADGVLMAAAAALVAGTRLGDLVVRWAPAQFLVLCAGLAGPELASVSQRLVGAVSAASVDGVTTTATASTQICTDRPLTLTDAGADGRATA